MTKVIKCTCKHKSQDEIHGASNRVANKTVKDTYRCTVCGHEHKTKE